MDSVLPSDPRPEEWMKSLSLLSDTLRTDSLENDQVLSAINDVEKTVPEMLTWVGEGKFSDTKKKLEARVQEAIGLVNSFSKTVVRDPAKGSLFDRAVRLSTSLMRCDKCILDQRIKQAVRNHSDRG